MIRVRSFILGLFLAGFAGAPLHMLSADSPGLALASDVDFAKSELSRVGRAAMTPEQRRAMSLVDRYRQFKAGEKRNTKQAPAGDAGPAQGSNTNVATDTPRTPASSPSPAPAGNQLATGTLATGTLAAFSLQPGDCTEMLVPISEKFLNQEAIQDIQRQLTRLGLYHYSIDGVVGSRTRIALRNFCESARFALADDLRTMLKTHFAIARVHPNWKDILASQDFARWARTQSDLADIDHTRHLGDADAVIALIERFESRAPRKAALATESYWITYALSKDDLGHLKSAKEVIKRIEGLEAGKFASSREFDAGLEKAFKGIANPERFTALVREHADVATSLSLTEQSFRKLKVKNVAPHVLAAMETLRGLSYPDSEIAAAVEQVVVGLQNALKSFKAEELVGLAEISPSGARFTRESMKKFDALHDASNLMTGAVGTRMRSMMEFVYQDKNSMTLAMRNVLRQLMQEISHIAPIIVAEAEEVTLYSLDDEAVEEIVQKINSLLVPEVYVDMLAGMEGVDYPTAEMFWAASRSRFSIADSDNAVRDGIMKVVRRERATRLDDTLLGGLREDKLPATVISLLEDLKGTEYKDPTGLELAIDEVFVKLAENYEQYRPMIVAQGKKIRRFDKSKVVKWTGGGCNCSRSDLAGDVYGIYPYWLAGDLQEINFSLFSRIGYFGLTFDDFGNLQNAERWLGIDTEFIRTARAYKIGLDLVLAKSDWRGWASNGPTEKAAAIDTLVDNISGAITKRLDDPFSLIKPYLSLGLSPPTTMANGITLYVDNYPDDDSSVEAFDLLIRRLSDRLQEDGQKYSVNLMFSSSQLGRGIFKVSRLYRTLDAILSHGNLSSRLLVMVPEPSEDQRAEVRAWVEQNLEGRQRLKLLRAIIMVQATDGRNSHRLADNATFSDDNFGGIGFWTIPVSGPGAGADNPITRMIRENYLTDRGSLSLRNTAFCSVVCPHRWIFRIIWGLFLLGLVVATAVYLLSCNHRVFIEDHFLWLVAGLAVPLFLMTMTLLSCDPGWAEVSQGNDLLILVVMGVIGYALWNYRRRKELMDLP